MPAPLQAEPRRWPLRTLVCLEHCRTPLPAPQGVDIEQLAPGQRLRVPVILGVADFDLPAAASTSSRSNGSSASSSGRGGHAAAAVYADLGIRSGAAAAVAHAMAAGEVPRDGLVAVSCACAAHP
jgi:hypothetical protein